MEAQIKETIPMNDAKMAASVQETAVTQDTEVPRASAIEERLDNLAQLLERQIQDTKEEEKEVPSSDDKAMEELLRRAEQENPEDDE